MKELKTEIEINGTTDQVWEVLTNFSSFPKWNPFIKKIEGELKIGAELKVYMEPPGGKGMTFKPIVKILEPKTEFRWLGSLLFPGIFDGEHIFSIEPVGVNRVKLVHREEFRGVLAGLILRLVGENTRRGFEAMNQALKTEAEK